MQTATSSRTGTVTAEQLTNIQMKGRDVWGMLAVVPGVQDTNMNRSFTTWTSMETITINGSPNTSKVVVIDGVNVIDELGTQAQVNPNIDAVGEVQVISNGYTAENGRSSGGHDHHDDQVGHEPVQGVRLVQRPSQGMAGERLLPHQEQSAQVGLPREHSGLQRRRPGDRPEAARPRQDVLLRVAGVHGRPPAGDVLTHQLSDGTRAAGGLLADLLRQRERPRPGHAGVDHQPGHGPAVPG